jgi:hypothetical protein
MAGTAEKVVAWTAKTTGWTRDFAGDVLATAGGSIIIYAAADHLIPIPYVPVALACVTAAMLWKRQRRDNP